MSFLNAVPYVDTVIVGNGPSALILSYILHGNIPYYDIEHPHPDPILDAKLKESACLLSLDVPELTAHFDASRISYSTQALPVNVLLDTLLRPLTDVEPGEHASSVIWRHQPEKAVDHVVIGNSPLPGGQWLDNPVAASWNIRALSYSEQLSLPGYSLVQHCNDSPGPCHCNCDAERPTRGQIADYLATYPTKVKLEDSVRCKSEIAGISRTGDGFHISSHNIRCRHLVLASGVFTKLVPPPPILRPLLELKLSSSCEVSGPLLVIGSGFSAADIIISNIQNRKIVHLFKWMPEDRPSPLQACHPQAYPDYAAVYRKMKEATKKQSQDESLFSPTPRKHKPFFDEWLWSRNYEGLANAIIRNVQVQNDKATLQIELPSGQELIRKIMSFAYVVGRRGSLSYLDSSLRAEILSDSKGVSEDGKPSIDLISGRTLRDRTEVDVQVAPSVFAIGSLTGDSLIRFAYGGCVQAAGKIISGQGKILTNARDPGQNLLSSNDNGASPPYSLYQVTNGHEHLDDHLTAPDTRKDTGKESARRRKDMCRNM